MIDIIKTRSPYTEKLILILSYLASVCFLGQLFKISIIVSLCFTSSIILILGVVILDVFSKKRVNAILVFMLMIMFFGIVLSDIKMNFNYYKRAIITLCTLICVNYASEFKADFKAIRHISYLFVTVSTILIVCFYFLGYDKIYHGSTEAVSLNFSNSNAAALWVLGIFILVFNSFWIFKSKILRVIISLELLGLLRIISATDSRTSILAAIVFSVFVIFVKIKRRKFDIPNWLIMLLVAAPAVVFVFYMYVMIPYVDFFNEIFSIFESDKSIATRYKIWNIVINDFENCFLFGDYQKYFDEQMHNSLATIFTMFGFPFTVLVVSYMYTGCKKLQKNQGTLSMISVCAILLTGCFEASVFVGVAGFYLIIIIAPLLVSKNLNFKSEK